MFLAWGDLVAALQLMRKTQRSQPGLGEEVKVHFGYSEFPWTCGSLVVGHQVT